MSTRRAAGGNSTAPTGADGAVPGREGVFAAPCVGGGAVHRGRGGGLRACAARRCGAVGMGGLPPSGGRPCRLRLGRPARRLGGAFRRRCPPCAPHGSGAEDGARRERGPPWPASGPVPSRGGCGDAARRGEGGRRTHRLLFARRPPAAQGRPAGRCGRTAAAGGRDVAGGRLSRADKGGGAALSAAGAVGPCGRTGGLRGRARRCARGLGGARGRACALRRRGAVVVP